MEKGKFLFVLMIFRDTHVYVLLEKNLTHLKFSKIYVNDFKEKKGV